MFVTNDRLLEVAEGMQCKFEFGNLHSRSSLREVASEAQEELRDLGLPTRRSLAFVVAKMAIAKWHEAIVSTRAELGPMAG